MERFKRLVNSTVYGGLVTQVQLRLSQKTLEEIDINKNQVTILYIGHTKKVYDDFSKFF